MKGKLIEADMHRFCCDYDAITLYKSGEFNYRYKTQLDGKIHETDQEELADQDVRSFLNCKFRTYITADYLVLYRIFGLYKASKDDEAKGAKHNGRFLTTEFAESQIDAKIRLALDQRWKNTRMYEAKVVVPPGTTISVGIVAPITTVDGKVFAGGADQILLPYNWNENWIIGYRRVSARQLQVEPRYYTKDPVNIIINEAHKAVCPMCCDTNTVKLAESERFIITGRNGGVYTMKLHCLNANCGYYW